MKGYSMEIPENCARARLEGVNASYKDLSEVCGRIRNKRTDWALEFLEKASEGEVPVYFARHNRNLGHRRELGGRKGRYPEKAAGIVLKALRSAIANGRTLGFGEVYKIIGANANKKMVYPRMAPKGRQARSFLETSRVEIVLKGSEVPKGVSVTPPKKEEPKKEEKKTEKKGEKKAGEPKKEESPPPTTALKEEGRQEHKHELEKVQDAEKKREEVPHQHGEYDKR